MRSKVLYSIFTCSLLFVVQSCNNKKSDDVAVPEGMHALNLSKYGKPFSLFVPDTTRTHIIITEQSSGALEVRGGYSFGISINEHAADLVLLKEDLKADEVNKLKEIIKEEPTSLVWKSEIIQPEYHFFTNKKVGDTEYSFEDIKNTEADPYTKDAVLRMYEACNNIQKTQN